MNERRIVWPIIGVIGSNIENALIGDQAFANVLFAPPEHKGQNASGGGVDGLPEPTWVLLASLCRAGERFRRCGWRHRPDSPEEWRNPVSTVQALENLVEEPPEIIDDEQKWMRFGKRPDQLIHNFCGQRCDSTVNIRAFDLISTSLRSL
jgi:hypothetical protein